MVQVQGGIVWVMAPGKPARYSEPRRLKKAYVGKTANGLAFVSFRKSGSAFGMSRVPGRSSSLIRTER